MTRISFMPFKDPRRERCGLCRQRLALAYLFLVSDGGRVAGEMELCARCALLLKDIFTHDGELENMVADGEEGE
jgi:hypothetical protein